VSKSKEEELPEGEDGSEWFRADKPIEKVVEFNGKKWTFEVVDVGFIEGLQLMKSVAKERNGIITVDADQYVIAAGLKWIKKAPWPVTADNLLRLKKEAGAAIWQLIPSLTDMIFGSEISEVETKN
jgi:hypothetical protein